MEFGHVRQIAIRVYTLIDVKKRNGESTLD